MTKIFYSLMVYLCLNLTAVANVNVTFSVEFDATLGGVQDGRLLLMLANNDSSEPRFQINPAAKGQIIFGLDVNDWTPGEPMSINNDVLGYPF